MSKHKDGAVVVRQAHGDLEAAQQAAQQSEVEDFEERMVERRDAELDEAELGAQRRRRKLPMPDARKMAPSVSQVESFAESFFGVDRGPALPEVTRHEGGEQVVERDESLLLSALNPYSKRIAVVPVRIFVILVVYTAGIAVTFRGKFDSDAAAVGIAAVLSPVVVRLCLFISERKVFRAVHDRKKKGQYPMVDWMSFTLFMDALYNTISAAKQSGDPRDTDAIRSTAAVHDERSKAEFAQDGRFFFDFVADTGDGFDPTFTVASLLGKRSLSVVERREGGKAHAVELPRARVVCHGGDICYPFSTYENFFFRFIQPYSWAFPRVASAGEAMYLAAGNHEYMDGLDGFRNIILPRKNIGGWRTPQASSYFAIELPRGWVMFVLDIGPEPEDMDQHQIDWFNNVVQGLHKDDRIILMYHVPDWIKCGNMGYTNMARLRAWRRELGARVRLVLTGDLHYYRRMEERDEDLGLGPVPSFVADQADNQGEKIDAEASPAQLSAAVGPDQGVEEPLPNASNCCETDKTQFMVVGNGGAFNHATHFPAITSSRLLGEDKILDVKCEYPSKRVSERVWRELWPFMFMTTTNHIYSRVLGGMYMVFFVAVSPLSYERGVDWGNLVTAAGTSPFFYFSLVFMLIVHHIMVTANFEINTLRKVFVSTNLILWHTVGHVMLAILFRYFVDQVLFYLASESQAWADAAWQLTLAYCFAGNVAMFLIGTVFAPFLTMYYFYFSLTFADWHYNEAVSMIQIADFKGFLRIAITSEGDLELYSIVADKTPKDWIDVAPHRRTQEDPAALLSPELRYRLLEKVLLRKFPKNPDLAE